MKKYKPKSSPHLLENRIGAIQTTADTTIATVRKTVQRVQATIKESKKLMAQSREVMHHAKQRRF